MFKILGQVVIGSQDTTQETGVGYQVYQVPVGSGKCAHCTVYVTLAQGMSQSSRGTAENYARYKIHVNKASVASDTYAVTDDYGNPIKKPDGSRNDIYDSPDANGYKNPLDNPAYDLNTAVKYRGGDEKGTLTYYPKRENESMPDVYENITLDEGDEIVVYNFDGRIVVQVFGIELPNNLDAELMITMDAIQALDLYIRTNLGPSIKAAADYFTNTLGPNMNDFFVNHKAEVKTDIICASCP